MGPAMLETLERETGGPVRASLVWMHGLGADAEDFAELPELLGLGPGVRCVLPRAPVRPVTLNGGVPMRAWFDILGLGPDFVEDEAGIRASAEAVVALLERERARGSTRLAVGGFSQGGALALHVGVRAARRLAGVVGLSAWLPLGERAAAEVTAEGRASPVWMGHGRDDEIVRLEWAERSRDRLLALGCDVTWRVYPIGHTVAAEELSDLGAWLARRLSAAEHPVY